MGTTTVAAPAPRELDAILGDFAALVRDFGIRVRTLDDAECAAAFAPHIAALLRMPWRDQAPVLELRPDTAGQISVGFLHRLIPQLRTALGAPDGMPHLIAKNGRPVVLFVASDRVAPRRGLAVSPAETPVKRSGLGARLA
jgi:hypothetical protein